MNTTIKGLLMMTLLSIQAVSADVDTPDTARLKTIVESVGILADSGQFEALEQLYADEVLVDYTSLAGGEAELKSPQKLMTEWAGVLPGFDRTRHAISNINVEITGSRAVATADVVADHYVADLFWQVTGNYRYELFDAGDQWLIAAATFNLQNEKGTRDVFGPAIENALANPVSYMVRQQTIDTVHSLLSALEKKDIQVLANLLAEDVVQDMPFKPGNQHSRILGKTELVNYYSENAKRVDFSSFVFHPMQDSETLIVELAGDNTTGLDNGKLDGIHAILFHVVEGKTKLIRIYRDIFNGYHAEGS